MCFFTRRTLKYFTFLSIAIVFVCIHLVRTNWYLHARVSVLLNGYIFCHFESPDHLNQEVVPIKNKFVSNWVFVNDACVGYLDRYGDFVSAIDPDDLDVLKKVKIFALFFYLEWTLVLTFIGMCAYVVVHKHSIKRC
jgi:hypothetical protein